MKGPCADLVDALRTADGKSGRDGPVVLRLMRFEQLRDDVAYVTHDVLFERGRSGERAGLPLFGLRALLEDADAIVVVFRAQACTTRLREVSSCPP